MAATAFVFRAMTRNKKADDDGLDAALARLTGGMVPTGESIAADDEIDSTKPRCPTCGKFMLGHPNEQPKVQVDEITAPQRPPFRAIGRRRRLRAARLAAAARAGRDTSC